MAKVMRKILLAMALMAGIQAAHAFEFDGINLNLPFIKVSQEISKRGYYFDSEKNCLRGICQGTEIYLRINYTDVSKRGMLGQLVVEVPMQSRTRSLGEVVTLLNVIYHQVARTDEAVTYAVDKDGTQLMVSQRGDSYFLTYNTPYYKARR